MKQTFTITLILGVILIFGCDSSNEIQQQAKINKNGSEITYSVPEGWISETPSSSMRKAQFKLPGEGESENAEMAVFNFPGTGGSVAANLNRWYGQFKQPDRSATRGHAEKKKIEVGDLSVTIVYVTGTFLQSTSPMMTGPVEEKTNFALLAAIVDLSSGPWFFKAVGPEETIDHWRKSFDSFVKTFKYVQ
jgi:hypothetical protein